MAVSFALGFGAAWLVRAPADDAAVNAPIAQVSPTGGYAAPNPFPDIGGSAGPGAKAQTAGLPDTASVDELWAKALLPPDRQEPGYDAEDRLRRMAQTNPVALRKLVQRYETDRSPQARELLKSILSTVQTPEVVAFALRLASSSNVTERRYGFELVESLAPDSAEARGLIKQALATEQSPEVLVQALQALKAGATEPEEASQIVAQLKTLTQHADATVRRHSIMQLGQWDKKGEGADVLAQALADRSSEARQAAIFAIAQNGVRTDPIKAALLALMSNPQESKDIRGSALQALERFSLTKEEYASVARAKAQLQGL
ncbi:MAG: HEAT repeat domain-containing protein [Pseudomonadota bacterium]